MNIALDDFGMGYSSLRRLQELELVKIDRSFAQFTTDAGGSAAIIEGLARLGTNLGIQVVAERRRRGAAYVSDRCRLYRHAGLPVFQADRGEFTGALIRARR